MHRQYFQPLRHQSGPVLERDAGGHVPPEADAAASWPDDCRRVDFLVDDLGAAVVGLA